MVRDRGWLWQGSLACVLGMGGAIFLGLPEPALAQLNLVPDTEPDRSLGTAVDNNGLVSGGTPNGANLFHSFAEFNVLDGQAVIFNNPLGIENILSRVTGNDPSDILGTLGVNGPANLFLLNPNGITFGPNAQLALNGGSFVATTANAIGFPTGGEFSTTSAVAQGDPLLTVNPSALFFNETPAGAIVNQSTVGLEVPLGESLFLVGGEVRVEGGVIRAPGGRVELGGLAAPGVVEIEEISDIINPNLEFPNVQLSFADEIARADVSLTNQAVIDVVAGGGGDIRINAGNIDVSGASTIQAGIGSGMGSTAARAGNILLNATDEVSIRQSSRVGNDIFQNATSDRSNIFDAIENGVIYGSAGIRAGSVKVTDGAQISTSTFGNGSAGLLLIEADGEVFVDGSSVGNSSSAIFSTVEAGATGDAGGILIETGSLTLVNGGQLQTLVRQAPNGQSAGQGSAGAVIVQASDSVVITGVNALDLPSSIFSTLNPEANGNAGLVSVSADSIEVKDGATISTSTFGIGDAGIVLLEANDEISITGNGTLISSNVEQGARGNTLGVSISASSLFMSGGSNIQALTRGDGTAGIILVDVTDLVDLSGTSPDGPSTGLFTSSEDTATQPGGLIEVNADTLRLSNGAVLSARTQSAFEGGGILVNVNTLEAIDGGQILTTAYASGASGVIVINAADKIILSGRDSTFTDRVLQTFNTNVAQFGLAQGIRLTLQLFDNIDDASGVFANVLAGAEAPAGGILIFTKDLFIREGGTIAVDNQGPREAGDVVIFGRDLILNDEGIINATTASGQGGNIILQLEDFLLLLDGSQISTEAGRDFGGGDGGNAFVETRFIIAAPFNDNNLSAQAFAGSGGNIEVTAARLYDIEERVNLATSNDIDASSDFGLDGTVTENVLNVDPTQGLTNLPANPVDPSTLIAETCAPRGGLAEGERNQFIVTGRGGLPPDPNAAFPGEAVVDDAGLPEEESPVDDSSSANPASGEMASSQLPDRIEAQGWVYGEDGKIIFTAHAHTVTPSTPALTPASTCNDVSTSLRQR
jgi:filamentous hemagglutinin family protein